MHASYVWKLYKRFVSLGCTEIMEPFCYILSSQQQKFILLNQEKYFPCIKNK